MDKRKRIETVNEENIIEEISSKKLKKEKNLLLEEKNFEEIITIDILSTIILYFYSIKDFLNLIMVCKKYFVIFFPFKKISIINMKENEKKKDFTEILKIKETLNFNFWKTFTLRNFFNENFSFFPKNQFLISKKQQTQEKEENEILNEKNYKKEQKILFWYKICKNYFKKNKFNTGFYNKIVLNGPRSNEFNKKLTSCNNYDFFYKNFFIPKNDKKNEKFSKNNFFFVCFGFNYYEDSGFYIWKIKDNYAKPIKFIPFHKSLLLEEEENPKINFNKEIINNVIGIVYLNSTKNFNVSFIDLLTNEFILNFLISDLNVSSEPFIMFDGKHCIVYFMSSKLSKLYLFEIDLKLKKFNLKFKKIIENVIKYSQFLNNFSKDINNDIEKIEKKIQVIFFDKIELLDIEGKTITNFIFDIDLKKYFPLKLDQYIFFINYNEYVSEIKFIKLSDKNLTIKKLEFGKNFRISNIKVNDNVLLIGNNFNNIFFDLKTCKIINETMLTVICFDKNNVIVSDNITHSYIASYDSLNKTNSAEDFKNLTPFINRSNYFQFVIKNNFIINNYLATNKLGSIEIFNFNKNKKQIQNEKKKNILFRKNDLVFAKTEDNGNNIFLPAIFHSVIKIDSNLILNNKEENKNNENKEINENKQIGVEDKNKINENENKQIIEDKKINENKQIGVEEKKDKIEKDNFTQIEEIGELTEQFLQPKNYIFLEKAIIKFINDDKFTTINYNQNYLKSFNESFAFSSHYINKYCFDDSIINNDNKKEEKKNFNLRKSKKNLILENLKKPKIELNEKKKKTLELKKQLSDEKKEFLSFFLLNKKRTKNFPEKFKLAIVEFNKKFEM
jgi:hypothetical protein